MRFSRIAGALALSAFALAAEAAETVSPARPAPATSPGRPADAAWQERLAAVVEAATADNPELARMDAEIRAARERARQAGTLPDPELSGGVMNLPTTGSFTEDPMTMKTVALMQSLPAAGTRGAARRAAEAGAESIEREHAHHVAEVAARAASAFFDLAGIDARLAIAAETRALLERDAEAAAERYRVGKGAQADVLRADLEKTRLEREIVALQGERSASEAALNALLARPGAAGQPPIPAIDPDESLPDGDAFLSRSLAESPILAHYEAAVAGAQEEARAAGFERRPTWSLWAQYGARERLDDMVSASVGVSLPFLHPGRVASRAAEARARVDAARAELSEAEYRLRGAVEAALAKLSSDVRQARLYRDAILPEAEIHARSAHEAYAVGAIDFSTLVASSVDLRTFRSEYAERLAAIGHDRADLQMASGLPLLPGTPGMEHDHGTR